MSPPLPPLPAPILKNGDCCGCPPPPPHPFNHPSIKGQARGRGGGGGAALANKPLNHIPLRCGEAPQKYCGCTQDAATFRKRLPQRAGVTFCSDGGCGTACAGAGLPRVDCQGKLDASQQQGCCSGGPAFQRRYGGTSAGGHGHNYNDGERHHGHHGHGGSKSGHHHNHHHHHDDDDCRCDHGVRYPDHHHHHHSSRSHRRSQSRPETVIQKEKPVVIVNNTELCACESKWKLIERWQHAANRRERDRREEEQYRARVRAKERYRKRVDAQIRHRECLVMQRELERRRVEDNDDWQRRRMEMEDKRLGQEYDMWLEDLLESEERRKEAEVTERKKEARRWREEQLRPRSMTGLAVPELEELRRVMAPLDKGPNEIFEFFAVEPPRPPPPRPPPENKNNKSPQEVANALMGMRCSDGIHIRVGDNYKKRATIRLNMGPCLGRLQNGGGGIREVSIGNDNNNCVPAVDESTPLIPPEVVQIMMKIKEADTNNPLLRFNQTGPSTWSKLVGQIALPTEVGPTLAPYYCSPDYYYPPC